MNISLPLFVLLTAAAPAVEPEPAANLSATATAVERVRFEVDHTPLLAQQMADAAEDSAFFVREDGGKAIRTRFGVEVVDDDDAPEIIVKLAWKDYESSVYLIETSTRRPGEALQVAVSSEATCINNSALTEAVLATLPAAFTQLARSSETTPTSTANESSEPKVIEEPLEEETGRRPLGPKGKAGVGLLIGGTVGLVTGGIVFAQQRRLDDGAEAYEQLRGRDFRPPGVGVMVAGGVVAVTGAVLLILDRTQARRTPKLAKGTWLIPTSRGLALTGRF